MTKKNQRILISILLLGVLPILQYTLNLIHTIKGFEFINGFDIPMYVLVALGILITIIYNIYIKRGKEEFGSAVIYLIIGIAIPMFFKAVIFKDNEEGHERYWYTLEFLSGLIFLFIERLDHKLKKILENQNTNLEAVSRALSDKLNAENSIIKLSLQQHIYLKNYFKRLDELHKSVNNKINNSPELISFSYRLLNDSTENVFNFFEEKKLGVYPTIKAVSFYEELAKLSKSIIIFEPSCPEDYGTKYSREYIAFITKIGNENKILTNYYYISGNQESKTWKWLRAISFNPAIRAIEEGNNVHSDWDHYSHLIFHLDTVIVSCSVLPIFTDFTLRDNIKLLDDKMTPNFKESNDLYFAYRLLNSNSNSDDLLDYLKRITV